MRAFINLLGILLVVAGIGIFIYKGITYQDKETVAKIGGLEVTATTQEYVYLSPIYGGSALIAGALLLVAANRKR